MRSPHRGVVLLKPRPEHRTGWRARYIDPHTGRAVTVSLEPVDARTAETRRSWAVRLAESLQRQRSDLKAGVVRPRGEQTIEDGIKRYFEDHGRLRPGTRRIYGDACDALLVWTAGARVRRLHELTRGRLLEFRATRERLPKRVPATKGTRGQWRAAEDVRSPHTVNRELRAVAAVLEYLRSTELLPLSRDDIRDGLKRLRAPVERRAFLRPPEIRELITSARVHDAETFKETRDEHVGEGTPGETPRFTPVTTFVLAVLLTGCRLNELLTLEWADVDLDAREIHIAAARSKTGHARTIDLAVSPALARALESLPGRTGRVFKLSRHAADAARKRLRKRGAPTTFSWHTLRRTCGTYLTCAPGIFGAASAFMSARQLGHSVLIAERHYVGVVKIAPEARTLEAAMQIGDLL